MPRFRPLLRSAVSVIIVCKVLESLITIVG
jgi:hypothetical protein